MAELAILDTPQEQAFNDIVLIAAHICAAPIALISLLDTDRQWFKAHRGIEISETAITRSVCAIDIDLPEMLVVGDLTADPRTQANPLVTADRGFRFYAGAPLIVGAGVVVGRLCVIDTVARPDGLADDQRILLQALARQVSDLLDLRRVSQISERQVKLQTALIEIGERIRSSDSIGEMTAAAACIVGQTLGVDRAAFGMVDALVETTEVEADWTASGVSSAVGTHRFSSYGEYGQDLRRGEAVVIDDVMTDRRTAADPSVLLAVKVHALVNVPIRERGKIVAVFMVNSGRARIWMEDELLFLRSVTDRLEAGVARFQSEQRQKVVNEEISHRLKNMLAMVQAIANQTLRAIPDREPVHSFERRLLALSVAHDVLLQKSWADADLRAVAEPVVQAVGFDDRVTMVGPPVLLGARSALSFSLIVHELMTNACKYGSLSVESGQVVMDWTIEGSGEDRALAVRWRESGGPVVSPPTRTGFGSKLIKLGLVGTGGTQLRYEGDGFKADLRASIDQLAQS